MSTNYPIAERNELLLKMFTENGFNAQLVGNPNQPAIVINGEFAVSGYVHNKLYHFTDKPFGGSEVHTVQLSENPIISKSKILELIESSESRKLYKIVVDFGNTDMFFNNYRNENFYFSATDARYYFSYQKAEEMLDIINESYDAKIVAGKH